MAGATPSICSTWPFGFRGTLVHVLTTSTHRTGELSADDFAAIRGLLTRAFGQFDDDDWDHTVGGEHVLGFLDGAMVAHASVVERTLRCGAVAMRTGYVEGVAVDPAHQRHGHGATIMAEVSRVVSNGYELGALSAGEDAQRLYHRLGWLTWLGPSYVDGPGGRAATPEEDGYILVLPRGNVDLTAPISCDWRPGDVW